MSTWFSVINTNLSTFVNLTKLKLFLCLSSDGWGNNIKLFYWVCSKSYSVVGVHSTITVWKFPSFVQTWAKTILSAFAFHQPAKIKTKVRKFLLWNYSVALLKTCKKKIIYENHTKEMGPLHKQSELKPSFTKPEKQRAAFLRKDRRVQLNQSCCCGMSLSPSGLSQAGFEQSWALPRQAICQTESWQPRKN